MDTGEMAAQLWVNATVIEGLLQGMSDEAQRWRPEPEAWSALEVLAHLADEEREDFRRRLDLTLHQPEADWPPIDPAGWVTERAYNAKAFDATLADFLTERRASVAWLRGLAAPDWSRAKVHPVFGAMRAGGLATAWLAHDLLHIRQLVELRYAWLARAADPYEIGYAGEW